MRKTLLVSALALVAPSAALGANFTFSVVTSSPVTLPAVTLNGDDQSQTFTVRSRVDSSGSSGWKVRASADAPSSGPYALPPLLSTTPQTIYNARTGTGHGKFYVASTFLVSYPARTHAGAHRATITLSGSAGP